MTTVYRVRSPDVLHHTDPLHVGRFYPNMERVHKGVMQERQDLILYLANIHAAAVKSGNPLGFCRIPMRLMTLRDWVYDYRTVFDHFFHVAEVGYNLGDKNEISIITPRKLVGEVTERRIIYSLPAAPTGETVSSTVYIQQGLRDIILQKLVASGRLDLYAPVEWILQFPVINFKFARSGKLQLRDTSVWPVSAVETWPAWLREDLFGPGIDIESAYTQFLIEHVRDAYSDRPHMVQMLFPDLLRSLEDKNAWRKEICCDILGFEHNDENIGIVKKICMSLANGSRISPAILLNGISITRDIIVDKIVDTAPTNLIRIGERLSRVSRQYAQARKLVCNMEIGMAPTRVNQKKVFSTYFRWEREARYKIWEKIDRHGVMVHDGIDGVPLRYLQDIPGLVKSLNIRLT